MFSRRVAAAADCGQDPAMATPLRMALALATALAAGRAHGGEPSSRGEAASLDVATFNTWGLPFPIAWRPRERRFPGINKWLGDGGLDIVGLQEVWTGARHLLDLRGVTVPSRGGDSGLALYTPHRITRPASLVPFAAARGVDRLKAKGVLVAGVEVPDVGEVTVLVTHLQAGSGARNAAVRSAQIDELLAVLGDDPRPAIVMGDFNLYGADAVDTASQARLVEAGLVDAAIGADVGHTHQVEPERFDRVFVRGGESARMDAATAIVDRSASALSDHLPVLARLRLFKR